MPWCDGLKVTEGNVRQELGFRPYSFTHYPVFTFGYAIMLSQPIEASCSPHIVRSVEHNKERFKCFPKAN